MAHDLSPAADLGYLVNRLARAMRSTLAAEIESSGLTPAQAAVVLALAESGPATPARLADLLGFDRATMSGMLDRLERDGWIGVSANPADGRSRIVTPTEKAAGAAGFLAEASARVASATLGGLSERDAKRFVVMLRSAAGHLEGRSPDPVSGAGERR